MSRKINLYIVITLLCSVSLLGQQNTAPVKFSFRDGAYFYLADQSVSKGSPLEGNVAIRINRDNGRGFRELTVVSQAETASTFRKISGEKAWEQLKATKKLQTDDAVWQYILQHPKLSDYGLLAFDFDFRRAMGSAYLDDDAAGLPAGKKWSYRLEFIDAAGRTTHSTMGMIEGGEKALPITGIRQNKLFATDSAVFITWSAPFRMNVEGLILADVYRQTAGKGPFTKMNKVLLANIRNDSVIFYLDDSVTPQALYRYYIRPKDQVGNEGALSDTVSALSVNFARLPLLQELKVTDTLNALSLRWKPLANVPQVVGVEIQRSRDARGNYVVIDTANVTQTSYLDTKVFPGIPYFYRLRIIGLKGMERETGYSAYATATVRNQLKNPDPPYGLRGSVENGFIKLQWQGVSDPDLYAYFVYRSNSEQGKFEVISPGITSTQYVDSSRIGGRTQYVYAVKSVSNNSLQSEFSNKVALRQAVAQLPVPPGGANAYIDNRRVVLSWASMTKLDHNIAGYNVYRRIAGKSTELFDQKISAAAQAEKFNFELLTSSIIVSSSFEDQSAGTGMNYEYAIASVDVFGIESTFSPFIRVSIFQPVRIIQNCSIRKVTGGVMLEWDAALNRDTDKVVIKRKKAGDANYQPIASLKINEVSYLDKAAAPGILYIYEVEGQKAGNAISRSDEKNIKL
jgi:fibronectin type 3 domain-containing protein